ncbi:alpha/beta hydrolase [candidate division KSB1 bacterium]|nr:alpha/beta hydrolase [candidate division KSB1 bacterium]
MLKTSDFVERISDIASLDLLPRYLVFIMMTILFASTIVTAQEQHFTLKNTHYIQMKSDLTGRDHEIIVFLPDSYANNPEKHYPALYFMDAYWDMPLLNSIHGQLVYDNVIPELIMVGFSYPGDNPNYGELRAHDLTPTQVRLDNPSNGDGPKFLQFIEETVIPRIEADYRADRNERALSGSSLGGLFTLYVMYERPEMFKRFISISPAASWDNRYLFRQDDEWAAKHDSLPVLLFLSHGGDEYVPFREPIIELQAKLANRNYKEFALLNYAIEGERHSGVKSEGYSRGLRWVFKDIAPRGPSGLGREIGGGH